MFEHSPQILASEEKTTTPNISTPCSQRWHSHQAIQDGNNYICEVRADRLNSEQRQGRQ